jgi:hypothetical protein
MEELLRTITRTTIKLKRKRRSRNKQDKKLTKQTSSSLGVPHPEYGCGEASDGGYGEDDEEDVGAGDNNDLGGRVPQRRGLPSLCPRTRVDWGSRMPFVFTMRNTPPIAEVEEEMDE